MNWQSCLPGSFKTAPRIYFFFNCHGCRFLIWAYFHCVPKFIGHNKIFLGSVHRWAIAAIALMVGRQKFHYRRKHAEDPATVTIFCWIGSVASQKRKSWNCTISLTNDSFTDCDSSKQQSTLEATQESSGFLRRPQNLFQNKWHLLHKSLLIHTNNEYVSEKKKLTLD